MKTLITLPTKQILLIALLLTTSVAFSFTPPEVASGTFSCVAKWDEQCEDSQSVSVPQGYKMCSHKVDVTEQTGDGDYAIVSSDEASLNLTIRAKGNLDRIRQKDSSISIRIALLGVRTDEECDPKPVVIDPGPPKIHACACAPLLNAENTAKCLKNGEGKYGAICKLDNVEWQCLASKGDCREHHRKTCDATVGIDKSKSNKRLYITDSPFCEENK